VTVQWSEDISLDSIRERLEADKKKVSRLPTWEEVEFLLATIDVVRAYIEDLETPFNVDEAFDRIYELVGGEP